MRIRDNGLNPAQILSRNQYAPFGKKMNVEPVLPPYLLFNYQSRLGFISKEQDRESRLADHGVRKYYYDLGRFTSTYTLWEKYPS